MIARLFDIFFGCQHKSYSFPITRRVQMSSGWRAVETYVTCLECGAAFNYCWRTMRRGMRLHQPVLQPDQVTEARRLDDDRALAGPTRQEPLQRTVMTLMQKGNERKKA